MVTLDITKAFDTVCHARLLLKLDHYGVRGIALNLMQSYLVDRKQCVSLNSTESNSQTVTMGVPQGSVLGPLLFLIYINDLHADDTAILVNAKSLQELEHKLNQQLNNISDWMKKNNLTVNPSKSNATVFSLLLNSKSTLINISLNSCPIKTPIQLNTWVLKSI